MESTYSTDLIIELMVNGVNAGTWGDKTYDNLNVIQQAIAGYGEQSIAGGAQTTALTIANSPTLSVARNIVIKLTGTITGNQIVTIPNGIEKTWIVSNGTTGAFTVQFKTVSGSGATWTTTDKGIKILYSNGTNIETADLSTLSGTVASASIADFAVTSAKLNSFAVTSTKLASYAVTTSRLATNAVTAVKITQSTITQSKLAADSVGSNQLIATGVTPATYTTATITVDADGRITSASSGAAGGSSAFYPVLTAVGPASGTYSRTPGIGKIAGFVVGGGGGGIRGNPPEGPGGGGIGYFIHDTSPAPTYTAPYSVGGNGPTQGTGSSTSFTSPVGPTTFTATGGETTPGNDGTAQPAPVFTWYIGKPSLGPLYARQTTSPGRSRSSYAAYYIGTGFIPGNFALSQGPNGGQPVPDADFQGRPGAIVIYEDNKDKG